MMRHILVFEYLHAAPQAYAHAAATMRREGRAMLLAVVADLVRLDEVQVSVAVCREAIDSLALPSIVRIIPVQATSVPEFVHEVLSQRCFEEVLPIAPETDGLLTTLLDQFHRRGQSTLMAPEATVELATCKWQTFCRLEQHDLPAIPTARLENHASLNLEAQDVCVIKPRNSAGCDGIQSCRAIDLATTIAARPDSERADLLVQPWIDGQAYSVGIAGTTVLPPAVQHIVWTSHRPEYSGGSVPADLPEDSLNRLRDLLKRMLTVIPVQRGYVGIDLLRTADRGISEWLITEINPRLCTSYIGYRRATRSNLSKLLLGDGQGPEPTWTQVPVRFSADDSLTDNSPADHQHEFAEDTRGMEIS